MKQSAEVLLLPEEAFDEARFQEHARKKLNLPEQICVVPRRRSIDARGRKVMLNFQVDLVDQSEYLRETFTRDYPNVSQSPNRIIIVGSGPAGLFAALRLIELGVKPVVLERGKDVQARRRDIAAINKDHVVHPDSNYCFGEGGAGTYSDGKLYTRSHKRGSIDHILRTLVAHGAKEDILFDAHPHIGTNKLPKLVAELRQSILQAGGEIHFNTRVTDVQIENGHWKSVQLHTGEWLRADACILATGHSARDVFQMLQARQVYLEAKPFALGIRIEHAQSLIDTIQYHCSGSRGDYLPAASYALVHQVNVAGRQRGVFSFCMCPGGFIVPAATTPGEVVVNGMSPSRRDSRFANSGIVVAVEEPDFAAYQKHGPLAGMYFQAEVEQRACRMAGSTQAAPAQRMDDFVQGKVSGDLGETSYQPGLVSTDLHGVLPGFVAQALREALPAFGRKMKGYYTHEANLVGVESRTSSPVRIPRDKESCEHVQVARLFPCGEGAGYAGGIVSAAMDGVRCAQMAAVKYAGVELQSQNSGLIQ
ncbi:MAG: NAD(P)/FAD-dependent oxidoreductase [Cyclobacteriaceae bacterium]|jgi:uncharacterized FAD-dependent dehydrogenase